MTTIDQKKYWDLPANTETTWEPAVEHGTSFMIDWEITKSCNLDCGYCGVDPLYGGHLPGASHPPISQLLPRIPFSLEYADLYTSHLRARNKRVIMNVYGGEALLHPDIEWLLTDLHNVYNNFYGDRFHLTVGTTTNLTMGINTLGKSIDIIDEWTCSYHAENLPKHQEIFKKNLEHLASLNKSFKVIILLNPNHWEKCLEMIEYCKSMGYRYLPRELDFSIPHLKKYVYTTEHLKDMSKMFGIALTQDPTIKGHTSGRNCCGGKGMFCNGNWQQTQKHVANNNFKGWFCSVNWYFLHMNETTKQAYHNKDCKMNFDGTISPIGNLDNSQEILVQLKSRLESNSMPVIQCAKTHCYCGLCAPKARSLEDYNKMFGKYTK